MHKKILIAIDDSDVTRPAIVEGLALAKTCGAKVVFYYVLPNFVMPITEMPLPDDWSPEKHFKAASRQAGKLLAAAAAMARKARVESTESMGSGRDAAECLASAAESQRCDLIVIGSHGRTAFQRLILGSVVTRLVTLATVPLLVCKKSPANRQSMAATIMQPIAPRGAKDKAFAASAAVHRAQRARQREKRAG